MKNEREKRLDRVWLFGTALVIVISTAISSVVWIYSANREQRYEDALSLIHQIDYLSDVFSFESAITSYEAAYNMFLNLKNYKESASLAQEVQNKLEVLRRYEYEYQNAVLLFEEGSFLEAATLFSNLHMYRDSIDRELSAIHAHAEQLLSMGEYLAAAMVFSGLSDTDKELSALYAYAEYLLDEGKLVEAEAAFKDVRLANYRDSAERRDYVNSLIMDMHYENAMELFINGRYHDAADIFNGLGEYKDSRIRFIESIRRLERVLSIEFNMHSIAAGHNHSIGVTSSGGVVTTGDLSATNQNTIEWRDVVSVTAGRTFSAALTRDGRVYFDSGLYPDLRSVEQWSSIVAISAGNDYIAGLTEDRRVRVSGDTRSWLGWNRYPYNDLINAENWEDIISVAAGWRHIVGLTSTGEVKIIGVGAEQQLEELEMLRGSDNWTSSDIIAIAAGGGYQENEETDVYYITALLKRDGTVVVLGNIRESDKQQIMYSEFAWNDIKAISVGSWHIVGLTNDGRVVTTGAGYYQNLDIANNDFNITYVTEWGLDDNAVIQVSAGTGFTIALKSDGSMVSVGYNAVNQRNVTGWREISVDLWSR